MYPGQPYPECTTRARPVALSGGIASVLARHRTNNEKPEAGALDLLGAGVPGGGGMCAIKALEDAAQLIARNSDPAVFHAQCDGVEIGSSQPHYDIRLVSRIFNSVVEEVCDRGAKLFWISTN